MSKLPLTAPMALALATAIEHGGRLERHSFGSWSYPGAPRDHRDVSDWFVPTSTVEALVRRKRMKFVEFRGAGGQKRPIAAEVVEAEAAA